MRPPKGFDLNKNPLRHRVIFSYALSGAGAGSANGAFMTLVRGTSDPAMVDPDTIIVNPKNADYVEDAGTVVAMNSIIDRMTISLKFAMTADCEPAHHSSGQSGSEVFTGHDVPVLKFLWRPVFNVYPEKMKATDDDTGTTVAAILGMTLDEVNEDIVPVTTTNLPSAGIMGELPYPVSTVNDVEVFGDLNMGVDLTMEDHVFDESLLQAALRRYTNKGALRSCLGRTRHVTLTRAKPFANFFLDKFVPNAVRRIQKYSFFGIQVFMPTEIDIDQAPISNALSASFPQLGCKMIANYHEWNNLHNQEMT